MSNNLNCGYISLLYSIADKPLDLWSKHVSSGGRICRLRDDMLHGDKVIEIIGSHDSAVSTSIMSPARSLDILNIKLPILVLVIKNMNLQFKLEFQIIDKEQYRRRFSFLTYNLEKLPSVDINMVQIPLKLEEHWNYLEINLQILCNKIYGVDYDALQRIIIYPNCRLRRVYLQDRHYNHKNIPMEMFQAFFDIYMLKRGINFIERACQTEEYYTESSAKYHLNCKIVKDDVIIATLTKASVSENNTRKQKSLNATSSVINPYDSNVSKKIYTNVLNNRKGIDDQLRKSNNNITRKNKIQKTARTFKKEKSVHNTQDSNSLINTKTKNEMLQAATSIDLKRIEKRNLSKSHINEIFKHDKFTKHSYSSNIQTSEDTCITLHGWTSSDNCNNIQIKENNVDSIYPKLKISTVSFSSTSKSDPSGNNKLDHDEINNINDNQNEGNVQDLTFTISDQKKRNTEDTFEHIPPVIEKEAKLERTRSHTTYLTTDKVLSDFIATRHSLNEKLFKNLRHKGFNIPRLELLVYNAKNRNFYGQEKFIKRQRWCINKSTSLY